MAALFLLTLAGLIGIACAVVYSRQKSYAREREWQRLQAEERRRVEECGEVVLAFANHLGYIARSCISRRELSDLIDSGISPDGLAATISQRIDAVDGLVLGYHPVAAGVDVKLTDVHRERHIYIVGKSGSGKTNLLRNLILQDIHAGRAVGVIAPEAEMLTEELLPYIPDYRVEDVIYCNPADSECPVSFNPLHLDTGEDLDTKVDECLTIFRRIVGNTAGPRSEELLRQCLYALIPLPGTTLLDVERLLNRADATFRIEVIRSSTDSQVIHFWRDIYPSFPKDAHLPIVSRLGRFVRPQSIRNVLCNPAPGLNFQSAMDEGKILLFNLSDGLLGEGNSQLLGQLVVSKFQLAIMSRAQVGKDERTPFYLYLDEFQTFTGTASVSYERMLSRARKYKLSLTLAHQQSGQLPADLLKEIMGNVSTSICFLVSREDAQKFSREFVTLQDGEITHVPEEEILRLRVGEAWCKIGQHSFPMHTYLADQHPDHKRAEFIIGEAYDNYRRALPPHEESITDQDVPRWQAPEYTEPPLDVPPPSAKSRKASAAGAASSSPPTSSPSHNGDILFDLDPAHPFGE